VRRRPEVTEQSPDQDNEHLPTIIGGAPLVIDAPSIGYSSKSEDENDVRPSPSRVVPPLNLHKINEVKNVRKLKPLISNKTSIRNSARMN